jgi:chemotaxis protein MotB
MRAATLCAVCVALVASSGCVMDKLVEEQEAEMRAALHDIQSLENRLQSLRAETRQLELRAGPAAIAERRQALERDLTKYGLRVTARGPELIVTLAGTVLFDPGRTEVRDEAKPALLALAKAIVDRFPERSVRVEGHTDSTQPKRVAEKYPTNWELSAARSLAVLHFLVDEGALPRERAYAAAYGQHRPVKDNSTTEGREENRRVDIVILPSVEVERVETAELMQ